MKRGFQYALLGLALVLAMPATGLLLLVIPLTIEWMLQPEPEVCADGVEVTYGHYNDTPFMCADGHVFLPPKMRSHPPPHLVK